MQTACTVTQGFRKIKNLASPPSLTLPRGSTGHSSSEPSNLKESPRDGLALSPLALPPLPPSWPVACDLEQNRQWRATCESKTQNAQPNSRGWGPAKLSLTDLIGASSRIIVSLSSSSSPHSFLQTWRNKRRSLTKVTHLYTLSMKYQIWKLAVIQLCFYFPIYSEESILTNFCSGSLPIAFAISTKILTSLGSMSAAKIKIPCKFGWCPLN